MKTNREYRGSRNKVGQFVHQGSGLINLVDNRPSTVRQSSMIQAIQKCGQERSIMPVGNGITCIQRALPNGWQATINTWLLANTRVTSKNWDKNMTPIYKLFPNRDKKVDDASIKAYVQSYFDVPSSRDLQVLEVERQRTAELTDIRDNLVKIVNREGHMAGELPTGYSGAITGGHLPLEVHNKWDSDYNVTFNPPENATCQRSDLTIKSEKDGNKRNYTKANIGKDKHTIFPAGMSLVNLEAAVKTATKTEASPTNFNIQTTAGQVEIETINLNEPKNGTLYPVV